MSGAAGTFVFPTSLASADLTTGPDGARGMEEPFSGINGRQTIAGRHFWVPVLPLTSGTMSGGIHFGASLVGGTDVTRHLALWGTNYGIAANNASLLQGTAYNGDQFDFYTAQGWSLRLRTSEIHFSSDGWRISSNRGNGDLIYFDWASNALFGISATWPMVVIWGNFQTTGSISAGDTVYHNISGRAYHMYWEGGGDMSSYMYLAPPGGGWTLQRFGFACDEMFKEGVAPAAFDCLSAVRKVRLYRFRWRDQGRDGLPRSARADAPLIRVGFIAQRLREDFPDAIRRYPEGERPPGRGVEPLGTDANLMLATLTGAIQQVDAMITAKLEARRAATD